MIARFLSDGRIDRTFATAGVRRLPSAGTTVGVQPDGKILHATGYSLARFTRGGRLDQAFGVRGSAAYTRSGSLTAFVVQPDGSIVTEATSRAGRPTLTRYTPHGELDRSFGTNGRAALRALRCAQSCAPAVQRDGKIVLAGSARSAAGGSDFALTRLTATGMLDTAFGDGGTTRTAFGRGHRGYAHAVVVQPNGRIVAVGEFADGGRSVMAVARTGPTASWTTRSRGERRRCAPAGAPLSVERSWSSEAARSLWRPT